MAYPAVTYTFTNGTTASATEVNQNFTDLINGLSDGTKDLSISALTVAGTASLNGAVNIGNATSDDIAVNGYITTALIPKADDSYDLGTAALAWQDAYFEGVVYTDTIQALNGSGISFKENGGTGVMSISDAGAVTVGPSAGGVTHLIYGGIASKAAEVTLEDNVSVANVMIAGVGGAGALTVNGLSGGVLGQILFIYSGASTRTITLKHNSGTGTQKFLCANSADVNIRAYGVVVCLYVGSYWLVSQI
jgi:hypothetical protein